MSGHGQRMVAEAKGKRSSAGEKSGPGERTIRFYARAAKNEAEAIEISEAAEVEGLEEEIAVLRVQLRAALNEEKRDFPMILKGVEVLMKAVGTQYRLSPRARKDLADNFAAVLNSFGDQILPADR